MNWELTATAADAAACVQVFGRLTATNSSCKDGCTPLDHHCVRRAGGSVCGLKSAWILRSADYTETARADLNTRFVKLTATLSAAYLEIWKGGGSFQVYIFMFYINYFQNNQLMTITWDLDLMTAH